MGTIIYGGTRVLDLDDRTLAHVKVVILAKLRLHQGFPFSWTHEEGDGRSTIWIDPGIPLQFTFSTAERPEANREWIEELLHAANSNDGLRVLPEP